MKRVWLLAVMTAFLAGCSSTASPTAPPPPSLSPSDTIPAPTAPPSGSPTQVNPPTSAPTAAASGFPDPAAYKWVPAVTGLVSPTDIQFPDDGSGRMFILEQTGQIMIAKGGQLLGAPFLDISNKVGSAGNEQGLLGMTFHPQFSANPFFYVNYTDVDGNTVIARYQAKGDQADPGSEKVLLHIAQPFPNHNGGVLVFGPDGYLYAGLGDGGSSGDPFGNGQNKSVLLGKILRIDVDHGDPYTIPPDNPFGNEVWEYGLRNPWRISFDRANHDLYIADVGQDTWEEVDYVANDQGGLNFGWNYREGNHPYAHVEPPATLQLIYPVAEYSHILGRCSVTGGYVYRGGMPEWQGVYFFGDYCSGEIWGMRPIGDKSSASGWDTKLLFQTGSNITTFGQDPSGELYYADRGGTIFKLQK